MTGLSHCSRHQFLGRLPEMPVDEIGSEAAHQRKYLGLPGPNFEGSRLQGRKGLLHQLVRVNQTEEAALGKVCRKGGLHPRGHELDDLNAAFLQLEPQRLCVGVNRRLGGAVDRRGRQRREGEGGRDVNHRAFVGGENVDKRGGHANHASHIDVHLSRQRGEVGRWGLEVLVEHDARVFIRTSRLGKSVFTRAARAAICSGFATSLWMVWSFGYFAFTSSSTAWRRPVTMTSLPSSTNSSAKARPIPAEPPVMRMVRPVRFIRFLSFPLSMETRFISGGTDIFFSRHEPL